MILTIHDDFELGERVMSLTIEEAEFAKPKTLESELLVAFKAMYNDLKRKPVEVRA